MAQDLTITPPSAFGLAHFADLLPVRDPIVGEEPGSFEGFRSGLMASLVPATPYECVVAENLVSIEWELLQQQRMRDAGLRGAIRRSIREAVVEKMKAKHEADLDEAWDRHEAAGLPDEEFVETPFDREGAEDAGDALAARGMSRDPEEEASACEEVTALGMDPLEVMAAAYRTAGSPVTHHDAKLRELEVRRREVKRDFDGLQRARPVEATVIEG